MNDTTPWKCLEVNSEIFSLDEKGSLQITRAYTTKRFPIDYAEPLTEQQLRLWKHLKDITFLRLQYNVVEVLIRCDAPNTHWVLEQRVEDRQVLFHA